MTLKESAQPLPPARPRFKPYPAYQDSGVEWLGEIPAHWEVRRADSFLRYDKIQIDPSEILQELVFHYSIPAVQETGDGVLEAPSEIDSAKLRVVGKRLLVSKLNPRKGVVILASDRDAPTICSTEFVPFEVRGCELRWALYLFLAESTRQRLSAVVRSATRSHQRAEVSEIVKIWHGVPTVPEQRAIAAFLDRETARIDALVAKKERLIALLQEQRSALITRAVTKGLDPTVAMKDSGVEWLGEIPAHWTAKHLRWAIMFQRGHDLPTDEREDGQVPLVSSSGISSTHSRAVAKAPGIVTGRYGTIGCFHLITQDYWPLNTTLYSIDLRGNDPRFLRYMLTHLSPLFLLNAVKSAVPGVDRNDIHPTRTAVPPLREQRAIADLLDAKSAGIDGLVAKVRDATVRLKELRTALISAAVTGKMDVREEVA